MTYGDNAAAIRQALGTLLRQHRIQQRIGGAGIHTVPVTSTPAERARTGEQIRRYRHGVLLWCHQAVAAAGPEPSRTLTEARTRAPAHELRFRLEQALQHDNAGLAPSEHLTKAQQFELVDLWRTAARAAALGEHDFVAVSRSARFDSAQAMALLLDAAETTSALVVLDRRYDNIPKWQPLRRGGLLAAASAACTALAERSDLDYSIASLGWRPRASVIGGPAKPGIAGVVQAEHNLLIHLHHLPTALNLKYVVDSQRALSYALADRIVTTAPAVADSWRARASAYSRVFGLLRDVGGLIGGGADAAAQGAIAVSRLQHIPPGTPLEDDSLHALARTVRPSRLASRACHRPRREPAPLPRERSCPRGRRRQRQRHGRVAHRLHACDVTGAVRPGRRCADGARQASAPGHPTVSHLGEPARLPPGPGSPPLFPAGRTGRTTAMTTAADLKGLLYVDEVADFLGIPVATLHQWRHKGTGGAAFPVSRHLR